MCIFYSNFVQPISKFQLSFTPNLYNRIINDETIKQLNTIRM